MTTHEVLVKTRAELLDRGWAQGSSNVLGSGPTCVGIALAECGAFDLGSPIEDVWRLITGSPGEIVPWNDHPRRTRAEVFAALDRAIAATAPAPDMSWLEEPAAEYLVS